ncbi:tRNA (adenosine(37)-N6)-threonylcarbamoyltransferase complex dimerization subunit type 1 TsaB [Syntrophomonas erecta]
MYILAIDSATPVAGVALVDDGKVLREEFVNFKKTHSETLMPMVDQVLTGCELSLADLDAIAVTYGPGSFTGLRIGLAAVKGLSMASGKPLIAISTLEVLAHNITFSNALVCTMLDARKGEVYMALYDNRGEYPQRQGEIKACSPEEVVTLLLTTVGEEGYEKIIMLGDGYLTYRSFFQSKLDGYLLPVPVHQLLPRAAALGSLALERAKREEWEDSFKLRPLYIRLSEAQTRLGLGEV